MFIYFIQYYAKKKLQKYFACFYPEMGIVGLNSTLKCIKNAFNAFITSEHIVLIWLWVCFPACPSPAQTLFDFCLSFYCHALSTLFCSQITVYLIWVITHTNEHVQRPYS